MLIIAPTLRVPYPIVLVIGGLALGFVPGMPELELPPDLVLVAVLPPLLYAGTFFTSLHELKLNMRPIGLLSVGLVIVTTARRGRRRPLRDRRSRLELGVRARRHRLAHGPDRRDGHRPPLRRPTTSGDDRGGREPDQRRHRTRGLPVRGRGGRQRELLHMGGRARVRLQRGRGRRDRPRRRVADPPCAPPNRQPTGRDHDRPAERLSRLHPCRIGSCVGGARCGHGRHLHGCAHLGAHDRPDACARRRDVGDRRLPPQRTALRADRASAAGDPRRALGRAGRDAAPLRR